MKASTRAAIREINEEADKWCFALHGNHDEHQCHLKPGHEDVPEAPGGRDDTHVCYCGVWW